MRVARDSKKIMRRLQEEGWVLVGAKGSHHKLRHTATGRIIVVPHPRKDMPIGTARSIAKHAGWIGDAS